MSLREAVFSSTLVQLKQNFDTTRLEKFPSKSLLSLNEWQLEERRLMLERYLHTGEGEGRGGRRGREGGGGYKLYSQCKGGLLVM